MLKSCSRGTRASDEPFGVPALCLRDLLIAPKHLRGENTWSRCGVHLRWPGEKKSHNMHTHTSVIRYRAPFHPCEVRPQHETTKHAWEKRGRRLRQKTSGIHFHAPGRHSMVQSQAYPVSSGDGCLHNMRHTIKKVRVLTLDARLALPIDWLH